MFFKKFLFFLFLISFSFIAFPDQDIPPGNYGPPYLYPENPEDRLYKLPWQAGITVTTSDGYGSEPGGSHHPDYAVDWSHPHQSPILAVRAGHVRAINKPDQECNISGSMGNRVTVWRLDSLRDSTKENGWRLCRTEDYYNHVYHEVPVKIGDWVEQGQVIAYISCTGMDGGGPHLHFEVWLRDYPVKHQGEMPNNPGYYFISIPSPFVEVTMHPNGLPEQGDRLTSQNELYVPSIQEKDNSSVIAPCQGLSIAPNPARQKADVSVYLSNTRQASLDIFNIKGKKVASLAKGKFEKEKLHSYTWRAAMYPAGIYLCRLQTKERVFTKKLLRVK